MLKRVRIGVSSTSLAGLPPPGDAPVNLSQYWCYGMANSPYIKFPALSPLRLLSAYIGAIIPGHSSLVYETEEVLNMRLYALLVMALICMIVAGCPKTDDGTGAGDTGASMSTPGGDTGSAAGGTEAASNPCAPAGDAANPCAPAGDAANPCAPANPCNPCGTANPCAPPAEGGENPCAPPAEGGANPCAPPAEGGENPCAPPAEGGETTPPAEGGH